MQNELKNILDELSVEEVDRLLDKDMYFTVDTKATSRIKSSVFLKTGMKKNNLFNNYFKHVMVACIVACMAIATGILGSYEYKMPVAYVDVDINPSIELGINRFNRIVFATGYNRQGEDILEVNNVINKDVQEGIQTIIGTANKKGFLIREGEGVVSVAVVVDDFNKAQKLTDLSKEAIKQYSIQEKLQVEVVTSQLALKARDEAKEIGITPGKLNLIEKLQALDEEVTVQAYKDATVKKIVTATKSLEKNRAMGIKKDTPVGVEVIVAKDEHQNKQISTQQARQQDSQAHQSENKPQNKLQDKQKNKKKDTQEDKQKDKQKDKDESKK